jgi:hypothetical protein
MNEQLLYDVVLDVDGTTKTIESSLTRERAEEVYDAICLFIDGIRIIERPCQPRSPRLPVVVPGTSSRMNQ